MTAAKPVPLARGQRGLAAAQADLAAAQADLAAVQADLAAVQGGLAAEEVHRMLAWESPDDHSCTAQHRLLPLCAQRLGQRNRLESLPGRAGWRCRFTVIGRSTKSDPASYTPAGPLSIRSRLKGIRLAAFAEQKA